MILYPNAKINLGLQIIGRRADGYHLLDSVFYPIPLCDILEILPRGNADRLSVYGDVAVGPVEDNLVLRAVRRLRERYSFSPVDIHLYKHIPSGAGMGGGSSDATFTLRGLRELFALEVSDDELRDIAEGIGADCPFFVDNVPSLVSGIGEELTPAPELGLSGMWLVLIKPEVHISTAEAFRGLGAIGGYSSTVLEAVSRYGVDQWRGRLVNDFERSLFPNYPILAELKAWHYAHGALYASMTGSGATVYGLYQTALPEATLRGLGYSFVWQVQLP